MRRMYRLLGWAVGLGSLATCGSGTKDVTQPPPVQAVPVASITLSRTAVALFVGASEQVFATTRDQSGTLLNRTVVWSSNDSTIATVSGGVIKGERVGSATITATSDGKVSTVSVNVAPTPNFTLASVSAGGAHTCGLTPNGAAYCWGRDESGQLGVPAAFNICNSDSGPFACSTFALAVTGGLAFTQIDAGGAHTCALTADGTAYCWGQNSNGQLGDNTTTVRNAPTSVNTSLKFVAIDAGATHTCAITIGGVAYCWGGNFRGQLGDGTTTSRSIPVAVSGGLQFKQIATGGYLIGHTCGLTPAGAAYCWGDNERGQLGLGTADVDAHPTPGPVQGSIVFSQLTAGLGRHTCGVSASTGAAYCWGENSTGALGVGSRVDSPYPVQASGQIVFSQLAAGGFNGHTCGRTATSVYCWGENVSTQLGFITEADQLTPAPIPTSLVFTSLTAGYRHTCGRTSTGTVYCWGSNAVGQLGIASVFSLPTPTKVVGQP